MSDRKSRTIKVAMLARVEGEGGLEVRVRGGRVADVKFRIFEPPRLFEAFLRGRRFTEAPDITARICGICPVAYQMSSVHAMEAACGVTVGGPLRELRRLLYCGEWIESHALHVVMLHAPDFLGYESAVHMAKDHAGQVVNGLALKKTGNAIVALLGGREIHPINVRVGGFYRAPAKRELRTLVEPLERAREQALAMLAWVKGFDFPDFERDYEFVALRHPDEYPLNEGAIASSLGLEIPVADYERHFVEEHAQHSNALQGARRAPVEGDPGALKSYLVGPLARYSLNFDRLTPAAREAARDAGLGPVCRNPFHGILVRAVETLWAVEEALRVIAAYEPPDAPAVPVEPRAGTGAGATEAPRGLLFHRYRLEADGRIADARIVPPTAQNQRSIEEDLRSFIEPRLALDDATLTWQCEQAVRNYDPCISCATHFLKLRRSEA
jgi:coenzyme F420-reducing hydrogenase alpha subunit